MKIVIATPILYDPTSPFNHLMHDILEAFLKAGHEVERIVAVESDNDDSYKMGLEDIKYVTVKRKRMERANIIKRYIADTLTNMKMARLVKKSGADVLFEDASYSSFWSVSAAKRSGMKVVTMLQDVWPDNAVQSNLIAEGSAIYKYFEAWQRSVYRQSNRLICISDDMKAFIVSKGVPAEKIEVIYNWGYSDECVDIPWNENKFVQKYQLKQDKFYAVYAGNIGRMQNVQLIVDAAKKLADEKDIHFLIVGDGVMREEIEQQAKGMENITMLPLQPQELATSIYSMASVNLIPLVPGGLKTALPSKIGVCLSCGNPIIACAEAGSQLEKMIAKYKAGYVVSAIDFNELVEKIKLIKKGRNCLKAYDLFNSKFHMSNNSAMYKELLETCKN